MKTLSCESCSWNGSASFFFSVLVGIAMDQNARRKPSTRVGGRDNESRGRDRPAVPSDRNIAQLFARASRAGSS